MLHVEGSQAVYPSCKVPSSIKMYQAELQWRFFGGDLNSLELAGNASVAEVKTASFERTLLRV